MTAIRTPVLCAAIALNAAISVWASAALAAEPIVFIVSYHNLDYAKVACEHALQFEPDARNTMRNAEQFKCAEIVYDGPGAPAWAAAGPKQKNGQRTIGLTKLQAIACLGKAVVMAHNLELVEAMRARFRPDKIVTLFVGESAPDSDKFFYFGKNDMLTYTRQAIEQALGGGGGDDILDRFKALGWYLDDLSLVPVNNLGSKAIRRSMCRAARQSLAERIAAYQPQAIVTVVSSIKNDVAAAAIAAGCDAPRYVLPFAGQGHQTKYMRQLAEIIPRLPRLSGGE
jgi:hypothetical protein